MGIVVNGLTTRSNTLSSLIGNYISQKQQSLGALYQQKSAIEQMYNSVSSGYYTTNSQIYQLNNYYNNEIMAKNATISNLTSQINLAQGKITTINSLKSSYKGTTTSLDDFLTSVKNAGNTSNTIDFSNTNPGAMDVLLNGGVIKSQRVDYDVRQIATATKLLSAQLKGENITKNSKIMDLFSGDYKGTKLTGTRTDLTEEMTMEQLGVRSGYFNIGSTSIYVNASDKLGEVAQKLKDEGYDAGIADGKFYIDSRAIKSMNIQNTAYNSDLAEVMGLTVSKGSFSLNGVDVNIDNNTTIQSLLTTVNGNPNYGVAAFFEGNQISFVANKTGNVLIEIEKGTSNFSNVLGFTIGGEMVKDNLVLGSDGSHQTIIGGKNISGIAGNISAGSFTITKTIGGTNTTATITFAQGANLNATLNNVIAQINASSLGLTAEIVNDKFTIRNNTKGEGFGIKVEGGNTDFTSKVGLTDASVSVGVPDSNPSGTYFTKLTGIAAISNPASIQVKAGSFKINNVTLNLNAGTLASVITQINTYTAQTGVIAEHDGQNVILRNKMTGNQNIYVEGGTSNFGTIAGFTTTSTNAAAATVGQAGSKSTLTGSETINANTVIAASKIKINGTVIDIAGGKLSDVINNINANFSDITKVQLSINAGKLVITETRNGNLPISVESVSGNFGQLTGIIGYQVKAGAEEKYGSSRTTYTTTKNVTNTTQITDSTVNINGREISIRGNMADVISTINSNTYTTGVEAYIDTNNKFSLRNVNTGSASINFNVVSGDFGRVVGTGSYSTIGGNVSHADKQLATVTGASKNLNEYTHVLAGSKIQFGTTIIDLGASVGAALLAINNNKETTGVEALLNSQGQFVLRATNDSIDNISFSVIGTGDFGRVTGLGSYTVGGSTSNGDVVNTTFSKLTGVNNVGLTTQITASNITLGYVNDRGINVSKTFNLKDGTLEEAMKTINDANWYVKAEIVNNKLQFISRAAGPFQISLNVNAIDGVTGDFGRVAGMATNKTSGGNTSHLGKDPAQYVGAMGGLNATDQLIGSNSIKLWMTRNNPITGTGTEGGTGALASVAQTITFSDKDGNGVISLQDAIDSINDVKSVTKVEALLEGGKFVLRQIDANTAGEGDTINYQLSGNGDFARVAGYGSYTTIGQSNTGSVTGQSFSTLTGSRDITNANEVLQSSFSLRVKKAGAINSAAVDMSINITISDGTMQDAIISINNQLANAGIAASASIVDGKLQFKSTLAGDYNITVDMNNSDIGRVIGIGTQTTTEGTNSTTGKTAAKITGGATGLTLNSQITGTVNLTLQGLKTRTTTGVETEGGTNNNTSSVKTIALSGTIQDAINAINAQTGTTQIKAYLDSQGRFVLEQTNQNTENEFDTISFSVSGSGDFGAITGLSSYVASGDSSSGSTTGQKNSYIAGVTDNLKGTEQITAGTATITFIDNVSSWGTPVRKTFTVDLSGTVENAAEQINAKARELGIGMNASIDKSTGRFTIKSTSFGPDQISISVAKSDFARITGIANYSMDYANVTSGSAGYDKHPVLSGGNNVNADINVLGGTLKIGSKTISTVNKTIGQIVDEVNNLGLAGVTADLDTGVFRIKMLQSSVSSPYQIQATGDFARITGLASYSVGSATYVNGSYTISDGTPSSQTKSVMGLDAATKFVNGSIKITHSNGKGGTASFTIDTKGKSITQVVNEINTVGQSGPSVDIPDGYSLNYVYAEFTNGQFVIKTNKESHTITATGDFARVTGFSTYDAQASSNVSSSTTVKDGTQQYLSQSKNGLSSTTKFASGVINVSFENGVNGTKTVSVDAKGKTVAQVISELQTQANNYYAVTSEDGYITSRPAFTFDTATGKINISTYGTTHSVSATGDIARLTGYDNYTTAAAVNTKGTSTISGGKYVFTNGKLTGSTNVYNTSQQAIANQSGLIDFYDGSKKIGFIKVDEGDSLQTIITKINNLTLDITAPTDLPSTNFSNKLNASIDGSGKLVISYSGAISNFSVAGSSEAVAFYGLGKTSANVSSDFDFAVNPSKDIVTYKKDGKLTGSTDVSTVNKSAIYGQAGTIDFYNGSNKVGSINVSATDDLNAVLAKINGMTLDITEPSSSFNVDWDTSITAKIVNNKIQIDYGAGMTDLNVRGSSAFVYFYGLGSTATHMDDRSTVYNVENAKDVYVYSNGSITGSVDVKDMLGSGGSLGLGTTNIGAFAGQQTGVLNFVTTLPDGTIKTVATIEVKATDSLDEVMRKINNLKTEDIVAPDGAIEINKINGFKASFTADGKIQITYGGQHGAVRIQDSSGFAQYYGLTDSSKVWGGNAVSGQIDSPYPDRLGNSTLTGSSLGYNNSSIVGGLQSGSFSVAINGKSVTVNYTNNESVSAIMDRLVALANQTGGSGLFNFNGELDHNVTPFTNDKLTYSINSQGQIVISSAVESRTTDKLVITDLSGNFARLAGIATAPAGFVDGGTNPPSTTPGIVVNGTDYLVTTYKETGSHGSFTYYGASISGLKGTSVLTGMKNGGFNMNTSSGSKWINVSATDTVNSVIAKMNALNSSINASFDAANNRIVITGSDFALSDLSFTGDTSGFVQRAGLAKTDKNYDANFTNTQESLGFSKTVGSVGNLHESHILGNIQGGVTGRTETITINGGAGSVNITVGDDESLSSVINKIKATGKYNAGIKDGKFWIQSSTDSDKKVTLSDSNFSRIVGLNGGSELLGNGTLETGSYGTMNYNGASIAGLLGSSNLTIDSSLAGVGDGSFRITLSDKTSNSVSIASKSFDVSITKDMTVDDIMTAIKTAAVNAGVENFNINFDNSTNQVKISISGNQAEQITFMGLDTRGAELVRRLGLSTNNNSTNYTPVHTAESSGRTRYTGSISGLHGDHVLGNLKTETFTINGPNGSVNISVTAGQSLNQIITTINTASGGKYTANIDKDGKFYIESTNKSATPITISSTDFTKRVGLVASNTVEGSANQTATGDHGDFIYRGAGGLAGTGVDGMRGTTVFSGLKTGSFTFTLGATDYHAQTAYTVNVSASDSVNAILAKMKQAIVSKGGVDTAAINFNVEVDNVTGKGRIYLKMDGKDTSQITFGSDTSNFVTMAGMSVSGATTPPNFTSSDRTYGNAVMTGSVSGLRQDLVFGNMTAGTMVITAGSTTQTINIAATDSIKNIMDKIAAGGKFTAGLDENKKFYIKSVADNSANISVSGTSDFYKLAGINAGSWNATATSSTGSYGNSKITGSVTGLTGTQKFNNMTSGNFTIEAAGHRTLTVNVTKGVTTVQDVINFINTSASSDFQASLNTTTGQLVVNTKISNGATISVNDGTSDYAQIVGLTSGTMGGTATGVTGKEDIYSTLTGSTTGLDPNAKFSAGDFTISITNPSGTTTSKTFTLTGTESLTAVAAMITASTLGIKASLDPMTNSLVLESKVAGTHSIAITDGTSNFAEATGFTRNNAQIKQSEIGSLSTLTSSKTAESAALLGYTSGNFYVSLTDKNGNITSTKRIDITSANTVQQIAQAITNSGLGVTASISSTGQMIITRNSSTTEGGILVAKGTSDFTNKIGFTNGGTTSSDMTINQGTNAKFAFVESKDMRTSNGLSTLASLGVQNGTFKINGKEISILATDTINSLVNKINSAFSAVDPNGVTASFAGGKLKLTSKIAADNSRIFIESGSSNLTSVFGFTNGSTLNSPQQQAGYNAVYSINGTDYESESNVIALDNDGKITTQGSADNVMTLTAKGVGSGIIDIGKVSLSDAYEKLVTFVNKFNNSMTMSQSSILMEDPVFYNLQENIRKALSDSIGSNNQVLKDLAEIGISVKSTNVGTSFNKITIGLSEDKFVKAFYSDTAKVMNLLVGDDAAPIDNAKAGSFARLKDTLDKSLDPISGFFNSSVRMLNTQKNALEKERSISNGELTELKNQLSLNAGDEAMVKNQSELLDFLSDLEKQYTEINSLIYRLNKQYTQSLSVLVINKNNPSFGSGF